LLLWGAVALPLHSQSSPIDCAHATILCNKEAVVVSALENPGQQGAKASAETCQGETFPTTNFTWFKWTVESAGTLEFTLLPLNEHDDLDFVLYRLPGGLERCAGKTAERCMLAGEMLGADTPDEQACTGATGLLATAAGTTGTSGCAGGSGNFLAALEVEAGVSYALVVNNFRATGGFLLEFGGSCRFEKTAEPCRTSELPVLHNLSDGRLRVSPVFPNPATEQIALELDSPAAATGSAWLIDAQGRLVEDRPIALPAGASQLRFEVAALQQGVYFVKIRLGEQVHLSRFYKH
ncbi:MAG: T9SS type A sorting domain-containing protein, partial [Saprospiraceae bacterium]|nr:T9SS type A sorting domain-containing protein [Saprospiraceae bacterium]